MGSHVADRAIVLGGGIAGQVTARVLSDFYAEVLLVDRDQLTDVRGPRRGVPHGRHAHALLARGQQILEELFPGLQDGLLAAGVPAGDLSGNLRWYFNGKRLAQMDCGLLSVSSTRPVLEYHVRKRVSALPNVTFLEGVTIRGLVATADNSRIVGARIVRDEDGGAEEILEADLVVDATGRGSRTPVWLEELGYERPEEEKVKVDLAYTTRHFRLKDDPYGTDLSINPVASPANPRGAFFPKLEDGTSMLSLTGILGDHPPADHDGFLAFVKTLSAPEIYESVRDAEPVDEAVTFKFPASRRSRYERLRRFPQNFLVIGDGVCSFNPVYGQGMTVSAAEAYELRAHLAKYGEVRARQFFKAITPHINVAWDISAGADLGFPGVEGARTLKVKMGNSFMAKVHAAAAIDPEVTAAFFRVAGLIDPPTALMKPSFVARALRGAKAEAAAALAVSGDSEPPLQQAA